MSLFGNSFTTDDRNPDLFGSLASSEGALIQARKDATARQTAQSEKDKAAKGSFVSGASGTLGALGGLASVIPGGQVIGAGLGVLGAIISLFK
ncbi:MAG: hypothetical protein ACYC2S_09830 [Spirochaetales bacterium]